MATKDWLVEEVEGMTGEEKETWCSPKQAVLWHGLDVFRIQTLFICIG